jgi:hypothetical protein
LRLRRNTAALRQGNRQRGRRSGSREERCEVQAIAAKIMNAGTRLLRRNSSCLRHVRIGMRHRAELRYDERQGGDDREAQLQMLQSCQGRYLKDDARMLALRAPIRNCFTQISARRVSSDCDTCRDQPAIVRRFGMVLQT